MKHEFNVPIAGFQRIAQGSKTFLTVDDPSVQFGDIAELHEFDTRPINATTNKPKGRTGTPPILFFVGFVEVDRERVTLSLLPAPNKPSKASKISKS